MAACSARVDALGSPPPAAQLFLHRELALGQPAGLGQRLVDRLRPPPRATPAAWPDAPAAAGRPAARASATASSPCALRGARCPRWADCAACCIWAEAWPACDAAESNRCCLASVSICRPSRSRPCASESARCGQLPLGQRGARAVGRAAPAGSTPAAPAPARCDSWLRLARSPSSAARRNSSRLRSSASRSSFCASASCSQRVLGPLRIEILERLLEARPASPAARARARAPAAPGSPAAAAARPSRALPRPRHSGAGPPATAAATPPAGSAPPATWRPPRPAGASDRRVTRSSLVSHAPAGPGSLARQIVGLPLDPPARLGDRVELAGHASARPALGRPHLAHRGQAQHELAGAAGLSAVACCRWRSRSSGRCRPEAGRAD